MAPITHNVILILQVTTATCEAEIGAQLWPNSLGNTFSIFIIDFISLFSSVSLHSIWNRPPYCFSTMNQKKKNISNTELKILYKDAGRKAFLDRTPILIKSKSHCGSLAP